jgi:hypothetical protein
LLHEIILIDGAGKLMLWKARQIAMYPVVGFNSAGQGRRTPMVTAASTNFFSSMS